MNNSINKEKIIEALKFYSIIDEEYKEKCYMCIDELEKNKEYQDIANNIYNILYKDSNNKIRKLWSKKNISDLFGNITNPFITNILLLSGYDTHQKNMQKYNLDDYQREIHKKRVREALLNDIKIRKYNGIRISQMLWGSYFVNMRIIEVGRLQYEYIKFNPLNENEFKECIKIHIPAGEKLLEQDVNNSLINSKIAIKKYFNLENVDYYCESWLLSPIVNKQLDKNSNISKFSHHFKILKEEDGTEDILNFVFNVIKCHDYHLLEEKTSLQRKLKKLLIEGNHLTIGIGILKESKEEKNEIR